MALRRIFEAIGSQLNDTVLRVEFVDGSCCQTYPSTSGNGFYLVVQPNGAKLWRFKYFFLRNPAVSLADARGQRDAAKKLLAKGVDPSVQRKLDRIAAGAASKNTFGASVGSPSDRPGNGSSAVSPSAVSAAYLFD